MPLAPAVTPPAPAVIPLVPAVDPPAPAGVVPPFAVVPPWLDVPPRSLEPAIPELPPAAVVPASPETPDVPDVPSVAEGTGWSDEQAVPTNERAVTNESTGRIAVMRGFLAGPDRGTNENIGSLVAFA